MVPVTTCHAEQALEIDGRQEFTGDDSFADPGHIIFERGETDVQERVPRLLVPADAEPLAPNDTPENKAFQEAYQAKYEGKLASEFAVAGYDSARLVVEAIKAAGGDKANAIPREALFLPCLTRVYRMLRNSINSRAFMQPLY